MAMEMESLDQFFVTAHDKIMIFDALNYEMVDTIPISL